MDYLLEAMYATADAVKTAVDDEETFAEVARTTGYPVDMRDEHFWVSVSLESAIEPVDSGQQLFSSKFKVGGGITIAQFLITDWMPLRTRLLVLTNAFEGLIRGDPSIDDTCSGAFIGGWEAQSTLEAVASGKKGRLTAFWELGVAQYLGG